MKINHPVAERILTNLGQAILGKKDTLSLFMVAILADGHVLLEDVPGVGKTTLAQALARSLDLQFKRVQFTPDLMPTDILGATVLRPRTGDFDFIPGPVFTHILLADEVNRASPRTQSALLEAMSERQVTTDGITRPLPKPFLVVATQNPVDYQGTYPLPEAQLDRFLMRLHLGYPAVEQEVDMLFTQQTGHPLDQLRCVLDVAGLEALQAEVCEVRVERRVARYIVELAERTRTHADLSLGVSPRGVLSLFRAAQAAALIQGRDYATPDDIQWLAGPVLAHRLQLGGQARYAGRTAEQIIEDIVRQAPVPT